MLQTYLTKHEKRPNKKNKAVCFTFYIERLEGVCVSSKPTSQPKVRSLFITSQNHPLLCLCAACLCALHTPPPLFGLSPGQDAARTRHCLPRCGCHRHGLPLRPGDPAAGEPRRCVEGGGEEGGGRGRLREADIHLCFPLAHKRLTMVSRSHSALPLPCYRVHAGDRRGGRQPGRRALWQGPLHVRALAPLSPFPRVDTRRRSAARFPPCAPLSLFLFDPLRHPTCSIFAPNNRGACTPVHAPPYPLGTGDSQFPHKLRTCLVIPLACSLRLTPPPPPSPLSARSLYLQPLSSCPRACCPTC